MKRQYRHRYRYWCQYINRVGVEFWYQYIGIGIGIGIGIVILLAWPMVLDLGLILDLVPDLL